MKKRPWAWYCLLGGFYLMLVGLAVYFYNNYHYLAQLHQEDTVQADYQGNDWVVWKDTPQGVFAQSVHPIYGYKSLGIFQENELNNVKPGDRLLEIDYVSIHQAKTVDHIMVSVPPGESRLMSIIPHSEIGISETKKTILFLNGFRMPFTFNELGSYWQLSIWLVGIGAFISLIILAILLPIIRGNYKNYLSLLGVIIGAFFFFVLQLGHYIYLIVESDFQQDNIVYIEKVFMLAYLGLLFFYMITYFLFKSGSKYFLFAIPSVILAGVLIYYYFDIVSTKKQLKYYFDLVEHSAYIFFFIHIIGAIGLHLADRFRKGTLSRQAIIKSAISLGLIVIIAATGVGYYTFGHYQLPHLHKEYPLVVYSFLLFFPVVNAGFLQLQFGKVSLVVTRSIQYLVFFMLSVALYLLFNQLFTSLLPNNPYQRFLEFISFLVTIVSLRQLYLANENSISKYFISSHKEKEQRLKTFIVQIPQYTSSRKLRKDMIEELSDYFNAETIQLWWKGDEKPDELSKDQEEKQSRIYQELTAGENQYVWSKNKEISSIKLSKDLEELVIKSAYSLICPITISDDKYALMMFGKKRRGVYNLYDLELISQLIQQTQLTLNVLQLVTREKELIQQKYEADLMALRAQINPHFLFNTLNSLTELVHESPEQAEEAIEKLSFIFRYTTKESDKNLVPIGNEMELVQTYLELEKIRFGKRLNFTIEMERSISDTVIPAFALQTFVENCIKHGVSKILYEGQVSIRAYPKDNFLIIEVEDNGPGIDINRLYKSTGLSNTIKRFENIYQMKDLLSFENTGNGTLVTAKVPIPVKGRLK